MLFLPESGLLLAGDTLEDPITFVAEAERLKEHLVDLARLELMPFSRILPNHGAPEVIASGGYGRGLLAATRHYVEALLRCRHDPALAAHDLRTFLADDLQIGRVHYFGAYEEVHRNNVARVLGRSQDRSPA